MIVPLLVCCHGELHIVCCDLARAHVHHVSVMLILTNAHSNPPQDAMMALGIDSAIPESLTQKIAKIEGVKESQLFSDQPLSAQDEHSS